MTREIEDIFKRIGSQQNGQSLIIVLILLITGSLILIPLLAYMVTGLKVTTAVYEPRTIDLYSADAGVQDAKWKIEYGHLPGFSPYEFNDPFSYTIAEQSGCEIGENINGSPVYIEIRNVWIPPEDIIPKPDETTARTIVENSRLVVSGTTLQSGLIADDDVTTISKYKINVVYNQGLEAANSLKVETIGVWLPAGFEYFSDGSHVSSFEDGDLPLEFQVTPVTLLGRGNQIIVWNFNQQPAFTEFPSQILTSDSPCAMELSFFFKTLTTTNSRPDSVAWIKTSGVEDIPFSWNADIKVYRIDSAAGDVSVEAYMAKNELRPMEAAVPGDYYATGNTLMQDAVDDASHIRDTWLDSVDHSSSTVISDSLTGDGVPGDAEVSRALLYWTAWKNAPFFQDSCENLDNWERSLTGSRWSVSSGRLSGSGSSSASTEQKTLTLKETIDLSGCEPGNAYISWQQSEFGTLESSDQLCFAFYDNDSGWSSNIQAFHDDNPVSPIVYQIPAEYLSDTFRMRFFFNFDASAEYVYIDNLELLEIKPDNTVFLNINGTRVYEDSNSQPQIGTTEEIKADQTCVIPNITGGVLKGYSYSCMKDITSIVREFTRVNTGQDSEHSPGIAEYTVGNVDATLGIDGGDYQLAHAGWSLVIMYTSPQTEGHRLFLYDKFSYADDFSDLDFDYDGKPGGDISDFIVPEPLPDEAITGNAAKITVFVGEGDAWVDGNPLIAGNPSDFIAINAPVDFWDDSPHPQDIPDKYKLWDGIDEDDYYADFEDSTSNNYEHEPNNVWNGHSTVTTADGIDIDTFNIPWSTGLVSPGDTKAHIDLYTYQDNWNLVYIIFSFRSIATTSGLLGYYIH